jgi:transporter family-2 protein
MPLRPALSGTQGPDLMPTATQFSLVLAAWAFAAGALIPLMALLNASLARGAGGAWQATVLLFGTGFIAALVLAAVTGSRFPGLAALARISPASYAGGLIVGFYVISVTFLAPRFGIGNTILFAMTAQLLTSAAIDHFALAGAQLRPVSWLRALGLLIVIAGLVLTQVGDRWISGPARP